MEVEKQVDSFVEVACHLFLWIGTIFDFFQLLGKNPLCKQILKIIDRGLTIEESHMFSYLIDISSCPCALLLFKECIILRISWSFNEIDDKLSLATGILTRGAIILDWSTLGCKVQRRHWNGLLSL